MRIVSLCPSVTELVCDLGLADRLVGITGYCVHPADIVAGIEKVGGPKNPKIERILELEPELVLMNEEENRREDAEALTAAGLRCHASLPRTPQEAASSVRSIGAALGRSEKAEEIACEIEERSRRVRREARDAPAVSWAYLIWRKPWMVVGDDTFIAALLSQAGSRNVFGDRPERYLAVTAQELATASPDVVLLATEPFPFADEHADELAEATGIDRGRFSIVDGELLSWHGSRTPAGVDYAESVVRRARKRR